MEKRLQTLAAHFRQIHNYYQEHSLNKTNHKEVLKENLQKKEETEVKINERPKKKEDTPLMLKKINRHRQELAKNNLKKQKAAFVFHGTIDDFEKEFSS